MVVQIPQLLCVREEMRSLPNHSNAAVTVIVDEDELLQCFERLREGHCFQVGECAGKKFKKMAGLLVAPDMDAYNWMKSRVSARFFNTHVVRIVYVSARTRI